MSIEQNIEEIRAVLAAHWGMDVDEVTFDSDNVRVIERYVPDGPGWCGDLAWVVWGEACFQTILRRDASGNVPGTAPPTWRVEYTIDDMTPTGSDIGLGARA